MNTVQIFKQHYRGDPHPKVHLSKRRSDHAYCDEVANALEIVKGDTLAITELALAYEREKNRILTKLVSDLRKNAVGASVSSSDQDIIAAFFSATKAEVESSRLQHFAHVVDAIYKREFYDHYTTFKSLDRLLGPEISERLFSEIERGFPMHFMVIKSLIFGVQAHFPSRQKSHNYADKERSLLNYFLALIRVRDPTCLVYWAIVGTMGMQTSGAKVKHFKNKLIGAFTVGEEVADRHLHQIYDETRSARMRLLMNQAVGHHSFDNYNRDHPIAVRDDHGSVYHNGIVFNFTRARAFVIPPGSTVREKANGQLWTVQSSSLQDYWTCQSKISAITESGETLNQEICLPHIKWIIEIIPGDPGPVDCGDHL
jgi:hypothetical protein